MKVLERLKKFLKFLYLLEIQILNASEGSFDAISSPPKASILFFHANFKVCKEWFSRIRHKRIRASMISEDRGSIRILAQVNNSI